MGWEMESKRKDRRLSVVSLLKKNITKKLLLVLLVSLGIFIYLNLTYIPHKLSAILIYKHYNENIEVELTDEESTQLIKMFNHKFLYRDDLFGDDFWDWVGEKFNIGFNQNEFESWFDENVSIRFGQLIFCPSGDKSTTIKFVNRNKYFEISETGRQRMEEIFAKYGGRFPCI